MDVAGFFTKWLKDVTADQFELKSDKLTHVPTGAEFWAGEKDVILCDGALGGNPFLKGNGYDLTELKRTRYAPDHRRPQHP